MKKIISAPNDVLNTKAKTVEITTETQRIMQEMKEALLAAKNPKGVGLAAPQIGYDLRIFAMRPYKNTQVKFFINPEIIEESEEYAELPKKNVPLEGCLSIPNTWGVVRRKIRITVRYMDLLGRTRIQYFSGFRATIIQHEIDHLNGVLFTHRVLEQKGRLYEIVKDKEGKDRLTPLPI